MESLVLANITAGPMRAFVTAVGVAIGTVLILLIVGLAHGMMKERSARDTNMAAEIIIRPAGSFGGGFASNNMSLPVENADKVRALPGIKVVTPVGQYVQNTDSGIGFSITEGIEFDSYAATTGIHLVAGHAPANDDEVLIDEEYARQHKLEVGGAVAKLDRNFKVSGIFSPQAGARIKVRLGVLQELQSSFKNCTMMLVRCENPADQEQIAARIAAALPDVQVIFTRDLPRLYDEGIPALKVFLRVIVGLAIFISTLVILLAMYTAITERTKEIGVLKSLGASRSFIIWSIEKEALAISLFGVVLGYIIAIITRIFLIKFTSLQFIEFEPTWLLITASVGLLGGVLGALYPAIYAAAKDPVEALSYE